MNLEEKPFDVVLCIGVLHHLPDMQTGLERLVDHLTEDGVILLWLYGKDGRFRLNLNQRFFSILLQRHEKLEDRIDIVKKVLTKANGKYVSCHFNVPYSEIEDDFSKSLEFIFEHPQWLVDQFLPATEIVVDMEDIITLAGNAKLQLLKWLNVNQDIAAYVNDSDVAGAFSELNQRDKLLCLDLLLKPNY
jgi:SAM-dependent methyltransferase